MIRRHLIILASGGVLRKKTSLGCLQKFRSLGLLFVLLLFYFWEGVGGKGLINFNTFFLTNFSLILKRK